MTEDELKNSSAMRLLHMMIDDKARHLQQLVLFVGKETARLYGSKPKYQPTIDTRVSYTATESPSSFSYNPLPLAADVHELKRIRGVIDEAVKIEQEIGDLRRQTLRLFNDFDFTHGDPAEFKRVFGDDQEPPQ